MDGSMVFYMVVRRRLIEKEGQKILAEIQGWTVSWCSIES